MTLLPFSMGGGRGWDGRSECFPQGRAGFQTGQLSDARTWTPCSRMAVGTQPTLSEGFVVWVMLSWGGAC